jgi:hypothetical protein
VSADLPLLPLFVCLSVNRERLFKETADRMVQDGYRDVGYEYISIDVRKVTLSIISTGSPAYRFF